MANSIYVLCPDLKRPVGAIKGYYRYVDILNNNNFQAYILHSRAGFRCDWFQNETKIASIRHARIEELYGRIYYKLFSKRSTRDIYLQGGGGDKIETSDYLVIPSALAELFIHRSQGVRKVIFNRNCRTKTFTHFEDRSQAFDNPYVHPDVSGIIAVSEDTKQYMEFAFPDKSVHRHYNSIDSDKFCFSSAKKKQICYMPRKNREDVVQVLNMLSLRGKVDGFAFVPIENKTETQVAEILRESLIFLSFGYPEGCPRPPAEAMASGCIVVGYHGWGGREYFDPEYSYPIEYGDIVNFVATTEEVVAAFSYEPQKMIEKSCKGATCIRETYSLRREEENVVSYWKNRFANC